MQLWGEAYRRLRGQKRFIAWFGHKGRPPGPNDFTYRAYNLVFSGVTGTEDNADPSSGPIFGPITQIFDKGAVILGITSGAYQAQFFPVGGEAPGINIEPSPTPGRRDTYNLYFQFTDNEKVTPDQNILSAAAGAESNIEARVLADALQGEGQKDIFPVDLLVAPSTGFIVKAQSMQPEFIAGDLDNLPNSPLFIHVVFHCVIPKG